MITNTLAGSNEINSSLKFIKNAIESICFQQLVNNSECAMSFFSITTIMKSDPADFYD